MPVVTERARPTVAITTIVSPIGAVTLVRVVGEVAPGALSRGSALILPIAALSAIYGAVLAIGQNQGQRQLGYVWTSLMGTVLAGLVAGPNEGVTRALLHQLAVALSATGLALHLRSVAARTGTIDLRRLGASSKTRRALPQDISSSRSRPSRFRAPRRSCRKICS